MKKLILFITLFLFAVSVKAQYLHTLTWSVLNADAPLLYDSSTGVFSPDTSNGNKHFATQYYASTHGGVPVLAATRVGFGNGSNQLSGDTSFVYQSDNQLSIGIGQQTAVFSSEAYTGMQIWNQTDNDIGSGVAKGDVFIGDYNGSINGTTLLVSDSLSKIILTANNGVNINHSYTLPVSDGSANQVITTNGSGSASWQPVPLWDTTQCLNSIHAHTIIACSPLNIKADSIMMGGKMVVSNGFRMTNAPSKVLGTDANGNGIGLATTYSGTDTISSNSFTRALVAAIPSSGTVTTFSVTTANGFSGTVANPTTTPAITLTLSSIASGTTATTQTAGDNSTKLATTNYVANQIAATIAHLKDTTFNATTGSTFTVSDGYTSVIFSNTSTAITSALNLPPNPIDGQTLLIKAAGLITTLTVSGNGHSVDGLIGSGIGITAANAVSGITLIYNLSTTTWY